MLITTEKKHVCVKRIEMCIHKIALVTLLLFIIIMYALSFVCKEKKKHSPLQMYCNLFAHNTDSWWYEG